MNKYLLLLPALAVLAPAVAIAQEISEDDVVSVSDRARPDYDAKGINAGGFMVNPAVEVTTMHDDNIFADASNEKSDLITTVSPAIGLKSKWRTHSIAANVGMTAGMYNDFSDENYEDYHANVAGRLDVTRGQYLDTNFAYDHRHEDRSSPDDVNGTEPTQYDEFTGSAGFTRDISVISMSVRGEAKRLDYKHVTTGAGTVITNGDRDRTEYVEEAKVGYAYSPSATAYIKGTTSQRRYYSDKGVYVLDPTLLNRDSDGYGAAIGSTYNLTGKTKADVYVGYITRSYEDARLDSISNIDFGGSLLWNVTPLTSVTGKVTRTIEETTQLGASGYIDSTAALGLEHELRRNIVLGLSGEYGQQNFEGGTLDRTDNVFGGGADLTYLLPYRGLSVSAGYAYAERTSDVPVDEFQDNRFMLSLSGNL